MIFQKFGKVPGYIYKIKKELSDKIKEKEEKWRLRAEKYKAAETLKRVSSTERLELLNVTHHFNLCINKIKYQYIFRD